MSPFVTNMHQTLYDTKHAAQAHAFFDDGSRHHSGLDDTMLDQHHISSGPSSSLDMSPAMVDSRRESLAALNGTPLFDTDDWNPVDMQSVPSNNPFFGSAATTNPFANASYHAAHQHPHQHPHQHASDTWAFPANMDAAAIHGDFDAGSSSVLRSMSAQGGMPHPANMFAAPASVMASSDQHKTPSSSDSNGNGHSAEKIPRHPSPVIRAHRDGIRKKNARFDIPPERTLNNIDQLIAEAKTDKDIRDLKAQKRLLRNRQAALDSRQRKKQHTERLEDEKKQYTAIMAEMDEEVNGLRAEVDRLNRERQEFMECIGRVTAERDELIVTHTNETGDLRKKIAVLSDHVRRLEPISNTTASTNDFSMYGGSAATMDDMTITGAGAGAAPWDDSTFIHDYPAEPEPELVVKQEQQSQMAMVPARKSNDSVSEKTPQQGGLLFMLFLVGAFVLSSRSTPAIPRVSEDVRAASESLLDKVFRDAGISNGQQAAQDAMGMAPQPSGTWSNPAGPMASMPAGGVADTVAPSMLGDLGDSLTRPSQEQTNEQLFSLSAAQYNGMHSQDFMQQSNNHNGAMHERFGGNNGQGQGQGRKTLADALSAMRVSDKQDSAAEVYTRSLLWDQIPGDVVRNFAKMVNECNAQREAI